MSSLITSGARKGSRASESGVQRDPATSVAHTPHRSEQRGGVVHQRSLGDFRYESGTGVPLCQRGDRFARFDVDEDLEPSGKLRAAEAFDGGPLAQ
jgi:hypothetical protein